MGGQAAYVVRMDRTDFPGWGARRRGAVRSLNASLKLCPPLHNTSTRACPPWRRPVPSAQGYVKDSFSPSANPLHLGADAPSWVYSTTPLAGADGRPVAPPTPGSAGHAMSLSDRQVGGLSRAASGRGGLGGCEPQGRLAGSGRPAGISPMRPSPSRPPARPSAACPPDGPAGTAPAYLTTAGPPAHPPNAPIATNHCTPPPLRYLCTQYLGGVGQFSHEIIIHPE